MYEVEKYDYIKVKFTLLELHSHTLHGSKGIVLGLVPVPQTVPDWCDDIFWLVVSSCTIDLITYLVLNWYETYKSHWGCCVSVSDVWQGWHLSVELLFALFLPWEQFNLHWCCFSFVGNVHLLLGPNNNTLLLVSTNSFTSCSSFVLLFSLILFIFNTNVGFADLITII